MRGVCSSQKVRANICIMLYVLCKSMLETALMSGFDECEGYVVINIILLSLEVCVYARFLLDGVDML